MEHYMPRTKIRSVLPPDYQKIYEQMYKANRSGKGLASFLSQKMEAWMHRKIAATRRSGNVVLEIGAGTLNQYPYERDSNPVYDIIEPFTSLYSDSPYLSSIRSVYTDISEIPDGIQYDRILSVATFEHILNLPEVLECTTRLLKQDGLHCVAIPNEGHFLWKFGYTMTTGLAFRIKHHLDYSVIMKHEHVNDADEIEDLLRCHYHIKKCYTCGFSKKFCIYRVYICKFKE